MFTCPAPSTLHPVCTWRHTPLLPLCLPATPAGVWGYWSTDGLGLFEYMLLVEELHTEPIWVVNNGVAHGDSEFVGCVGWSG